MSEAFTQRLTSLAYGKPSTTAWDAICALLVDVPLDDLEGVLAYCREPLRAWPRALRRLGFRDAREPGLSWLDALFAGRFDPRLELVGLAAARHHVDFREDDPALYSFPVVEGLTRRLDPSFTAPATVYEKDYQFTSAYGCGGGHDYVKRGTEQQGWIWYDTLTEHAADDSAAGEWKIYGLAADCGLRIERYERGRGHIDFVVEGPTPAVLEVAHAWGELVRLPRDTASHNIDQVLAHTRVPWVRR